MVMRCAIVIAALSLAATGCARFSANKKEAAVIYAAGDKATIGPLVYNVTDAEINPQLGDDPASARAAHDRFYLVKVAVTNSGNEDQPIPAMTLVDDTGQNFTELADGANVPNWLGVVRKVAASQTEQGYVVFDAPIRHYRLRLNDPLDDKEIAIDVPLNFARQQTRDVPGVTSELGADPLAPKKP